MSTTAQPNLPAGFSLVRTFQGIDEYVLDNGLKVLLFLDPSQANVTVNITYLVGSRHEGLGEAGMAHLLEHMLFRGTKKTRDVKGALQDKGAQFNATTWFDRTNYFETLTPTKENLGFALALEADRMVNSLILREDLDSEMTVVRNEFEMGENNPTHVLHDQLMSSAYLWHNYGKTTIGNRSDIERVPTKNLRQFYEKYYQPDNAVLIVAGQFSKQDAIDLISEHFLTLKKPLRELDQTYTEEPAQDGAREVRLERVGDVASVAVGYHVPASSHPDHAALKIFFDAIADEPAGQIYQQMVESNRASEVFSMIYSLYEPGMGMVFVRPTNNDATLAVRDELVSLLESASISKEQVERIKNRALKRIKLAMTNSKDLALKLSEAIACGDWRLFFHYRDQLKKVSHEDVQRVAKAYIISSNRTSGVFLPIAEPKRAVIERAPDLEALLLGLKEESVSAGEAFVADAKVIEKSITRKDLKTQKVAILSKKTRGQSVRAQLTLRFGNEQAIKPHEKELWLLPALLSRGTSRLNYQGLRDQVDALMSTINLDGHIGVVTASIKSENQYLPQMLNLLGEMLADPSFKPEEFSVIKQREIDNYEEVKSDPQRLGFLELERLKNPWPKDHLLYVRTFDETIDALKEISLDRIKEAYQKLFTTDHWCLGVVGDHDPEILLETIKKLPQKHLGLPVSRIAKPFIANTVADVTLDTKDKEMGIIAQAYNFPMRDDHEDYAALKLANYMFGENMNSRLMNRIREKEGISYGAGSSLDVSRREDHASINIYAMSAPQSIERARKAMAEEWLRFVEKGVLEDELKASQESIWLSYENMLASDGFLVNALSQDLELARRFTWREELFKKMGRLSCKDILSAVQKWWGQAMFAKVTAVDVEKMQG